MYYGEFENRELEENFLFPGHFRCLEYEQCTSLDQEFEESADGLYPCS